MEERDNKNKFWKGVLVGALVTAFCAMAVVGIASGIWLVARGTKATEDRVAEESTASETVAEHQISEKEMRLYEIGYKLDYIERLIDTYFLFDEEAVKEDPIDWMYMSHQHMHLQEQNISTSYGSNPHHRATDEIYFG